MPAHAGQAAGALVALMLADDGDKQFDSAPSQVALGVIQPGGWQVTAIAPEPDGFPGQDAFLVKVNYELALEPGVPGLPWLEFGAGFSAAAAGPVAVLDALPRNVTGPQDPAAFSVGRHLGFVPSPDAAGSQAQLPAVAPFVDTFGLGTPGVRWRHAGRDGQPVRPGSYTGWLVLVAPAGCEKLEVELTARYDLAPDDALGYRPASHPARFELSLPLAPAPPAGYLASLPAPPAAATASPAGRGAPRVFISYAHDDQRHVDAVQAFGKVLMACGIDVHMDRWDLNFRRDWYQWAIEQVTAADFVVVVASPMCRMVGDGEIENTQRRGLQSELALLREQLHADRATWLRRLLPVVLPGGSVTDIPLFLQPQTADHFIVASLSEAGAEDLLRVITSQPPYPRPALGPPVSLPPRA